MGYFFQVKETVKSVVNDTEQIPLVPGQYLICTDTGDLYYDTADSRRKHLTDIIDLDTDAERVAILVPLDKIYFIKDTGHFWRYLAGAWVDLTTLASGGSSKSVSAVLLADAWADSQQTVAVEGLKKDQNGIMGFAQNANETHLEAAKNAYLRVTGQVDGSISVSYSGEKPICDIPITIILLD